MSPRTTVCDKRRTTKAIRSKIRHRVCIMYAKAVDFLIFFFIIIHANIHIHIFNSISDRAAKR